MPADPVKKRGRKGAAKAPARSAAKSAQKSDAVVGFEAKLWLPPTSSATTWTRPSTSTSYSG
jgi:hypothetical protein